MEPSFGFDITADRDSIARIYNPHSDFGYEKKYKPGTPEFEEAARKAAQYNVPLATYGEAFDNFDEVQRQVDALQEGGEVPSNDQQQLFVSIITDMANVLGVEPSQELAEAVMTAFENNDDSQGLITLFTQIKNKHMQETGLFREGGKMIAFVEKFGCGGKKAPKRTPKKQEGGVANTNPTARQARQALMDERGISRGDARQLQRQLMYQNMGQGMSRGDARAAAAGRMSEMANTSPVRAAIVGAASTPTLNVQAPAMDANPQSLEANYDNFNFNTAFRRARQSGADTFTWRGKDYGTQLAGEGTSPAGGAGTRPGNRVDNWQDGFNNFVDRSQDLAHGAIDAVQGAGNKVYDTLQEGGRRIADGVQAGGNAIVDGMQTTSRRIGDWAQDAGNRVFDAVQAGSNILGLRPAAVDGAIDKVQGAANRVYDGAQEIGTRVVDGVQNFGNRVYDGVQEGVRRFNDGVQNIGNRFIDGSQNLDRRVVDGVQQGVNDVIDNTQAGVRRIGQGIANGAQKAGAWLTQFGQRFNQ